MTQRIIISGSGGQGIMMLGKILAQAAMREGKLVTFLPAYGAEVRGGTANCMVVISEEEIGSPVVEAADILIVMNEPSLDRFACRLTKAGTIFINSSLVPSEKIKANSVAFPFTEIAMNIGNQRAANMVALGVFCGQSKVISAQTVMKIISESASADKKEQAALNIKAVEAGSGLLIKGRGKKNG